MRQKVCIKRPEQIIGTLLWTADDSFNKKATGAFSPRIRKIIFPPNMLCVNVFVFPADGRTGGWGASSRWLWSPSSLSLFILVRWCWWWLWVLSLPVVVNTNRHFHLRLKLLDIVSLVLLHMTDEYWCFFFYSVDIIKHYYSAELTNWLCSGRPADTFMRPHCSLWIISVHLVP